MTVPPCTTDSVGQDHGSRRPVAVDASALARMSRELAEAGSTEETVARIVDFAMRALGTGSASLTLSRSHQRFETVAPTSDLVSRSDRLQYSTGAGPSIDAATAGVTVTSEDLMDENRWLPWAPQAAGLGFRSVVSVGLQSGDTRIGSLNIYGTRTRQFMADDVQLAQNIASHASIALIAVQSAEGLQRALRNRTVIGQAEGILIERFAVDPDRAFAILRRHSQDLNIKLAEVARELVQTSVLPQDR